jgi:hypothetical protein
MIIVMVLVYVLNGSVHTSALTGYESMASCVNAIRWVKAREMKTERASLNCIQVPAGKSV